MVDMVPSNNPLTSDPVDVNQRIILNNLNSKKRPSDFLNMETESNKKKCMD